MIEEHIARALCKFLEEESVLISAYVQVIFYPHINHPTELERVGDTCDKLIRENSKTLMRFKFSEQHITRMKEVFPSDIKPAEEGSILLYVPPGTSRWREEEVSVGPTEKELREYRIAAKSFIAGYKTKK